MIINRAKNAKRNIIAGLVNKISAIVLPFVVRTVFIHTLGAEYLGLNSFFTSILQVLNLSELGVGTAIIYSMYKPIAENDSEQICALLNFYRKAYKVIGLFIIIAGIVISPFLPHLISGTYPSDINLYLVYFVYIINIALSYLMFAYKGALLCAFQRNDVTSNINTFVIFTLNACQCVILFAVASGKAYYLYILMMPLTTALNNIITCAIVDKMFPEYKCEGKISKKTFNAVKKQVSGLMITKICQISRNSLDSIFVSAFFGLIMTTIYSNYYYIMNAVIVLTGVLTTSLVAGVGNSIALDTVQKNYEDLEKINFLYMWISGWCTICLLCLYQPFMELWVGVDLMLPFSSVVLFAMYFYALKMGDIRGLYSDAAGLWWQNRWRALSETISNVILNYVLGKLLGVNGIILGTLLSLLVINFGFGSQIIFKYYFKGIKCSKYFVSHAIYAVVTILAAFVTYKVCAFVEAGNILGLFTKMIICVVVPNIIYLAIYFRRSRFAATKDWLLKKIR